MKNREKDSVLSQPTISRPKTTSRFSIFKRAVVTFAVLGLGSYFSFTENVAIHGVTQWYRGDGESCPQADVLVPQANGALWNSLGALYTSDDFKTRAVDWLGGAVRVPTESFDDLGPVGEDSRWEVFGPFHTYLLNAFPRVHAALQLTKVNTYGLLYVWPGSNESLKPILLMAHQDTVPVESSTISQWTHPPYSGHFDGENVWGRGSLDDKSGLIGILSSIESLLERGFQPTRTVVLSFGFDEEANGLYGARELSKAVFKIYGEDGIAFIADEGGGGVAEEYGSVFATPGIAEKGYFDVTVEVTAPGGHSSVPPRHTSIGILAALLVEYEAHPTKAHLTRKDPLYSTSQCLAEHSKDLPSEYRKLIKRAAHSDFALNALGRILFKDRVNESRVRTTQAIDVIQGGVKANALPEKATALINHRIAISSSVAEIQAHGTTVVKHLANKFNLTFIAFGKEISEVGAPSSGTLTLSDAFGTAVEPAPVTPTGPDAAPYRLLSGTIKATYNSHRSLEGKDNIFVSPSMSGGGTDTHHFWRLTKNIFRYDHSNSGTSKNPLGGGIHTVNERIAIDAFLEKIRFFTTLILNADEATDI